MTELIKIIKIKLLNLPFCISVEGNKRIVLKDINNNEQTSYWFMIGDENAFSIRNFCCENLIFAPSFIIQNQVAIIDSNVKKKNPFSINNDFEKIKQANWSYKNNLMLWDRKLKLQCLFIPTFISKKITIKKGNNLVLKINITSCSMLNKLKKMSVYNSFYLLNIKENQISKKMILKHSESIKSIISKKIINISKNLDQILNQNYFRKISKKSSLNSSSKIKGDTGKSHKKNEIKLEDFCELKNIIPCDQKYIYEIKNIISCDQKFIDWLNNPNTFKEEEHCIKKYERIHADFLEKKNDIDTIKKKGKGLHIFSI